MEANRHGSGSGSETQHPPNDTSREMNLSQSEPSRPQDDQHNVHMSQTMNAQNTEKNPVNSQEPNITRNPENESQLQRMNRMGNQQQQQAMSATGQAANAMNRPSGKQVPFALLFPVIEPQLDKDRAMQLQGLYVRLRNNNINKEEFIRHMRSLVGQGQVSGKHNIQKPSPYVPPSAEASSLPMDNNSQKSRLLEHQSDASKQDRDQQPFPPLQGPFKQQQQQHMQFPQPPFPNYGNPRGNFHPGSSPNMNMTSQSFKPQSHDLQMRQGPVHHQVGGIGNPMSQNAFNDMKRMHGGNLSHLAHSQSSMHKDHMLMSGKQFKILNRKLNSLLQLQADARGRNMFFWH
ncbi:unnamed protein product [Lactuca saligna]|uniref:RST domain-containing protein n=1 Tax=Lactuca saligna TaxID=75948 RepID=A0AA36E571_LACSI|nr:unnamed protein product [Lactuca saligna]